GERGEGKFKRITWDEAYDTVAEKLAGITDKYGPASVFDGSYAAGFGSITNELYSANPATFWSQPKRFLNLFGNRVGYWDTYSLEGALFASHYMYGNLGFWDANETRDLVNSKLIVLWGYNPAHGIWGTNTPYYLMKAKEAGTRFYAVDPQFHTSAAAYRAKWIPVKPTTDAALALAMAHVMITKDIYDKEFVAKFCHGFDKFEDSVLGKTDGQPKSPQWASEICGVPAQDIVDLAIDYATTKPAVLWTSNAPQRTAYGEEYHRVTLTLQAMTGNVGISGGYFGALHGGAPVVGPGIFPPTLDPSLSESDKEKYGALLKEGLAKGDTDTILGALFGSDAVSSRIRINKFADAVFMGEKAPKHLIGCDEAGMQPNVKAAWFSGINFASSQTNINKTIEALRHKNLEFMVYSEGWANFTTKFADIVLPINTIFERGDDAVGPWLKGDYIVARNNCIEPLGESKSDCEMLTELAGRLGFGKEFNPYDNNEQMMDTYLEKFSKQWTDMGFPTDLKREEFKKAGHHKMRMKEPWIAHKAQIQEGKPFPTPSGKIEIYSEALANMDFKKTRYGSYIPPIPSYRPSPELEEPGRLEQFPLILVTPHPRVRTHSQFQDVPWLRELEQQELVMNTEDADSRGVRDGDLVAIFNDRGRVVAPASVTDRIMQGVVRLYHGAWPDLQPDGTDLGGNPNFLTSDTPSPAGAANKNGALVQIEKYLGKYDEQTA
ncbi:MAG: molybdopterin-dependent oxidoreductase, partial [Gammaproteobacteria bacterium]|nr:molybdopterin-dependent oxidoreductase [Gammaproteobacteria bacterium]